MDSLSGFMLLLVESDIKMDIKTLAIQILLLHLISVGFILWVFVKQIGLLIENALPEFQTDRKILLFISTVILLANVVPITVDILTLTDSVVRSTSMINAIGVWYATSNAIALAASSIGWFAYYKYIEHQLKNKK